MMMAFGVFLTFTMLMSINANGRKIEIHKMKIDQKLPHPDEQLTSVSEIKVNLISSLNVCNKKFLSICIDSEKIHQKWRGFDFGSPKLKNLASALAPASIRIGGIASDHLIFNPSDTEESLYLERNNYTKQKKANFDFFSGRAQSHFTMPAKIWEYMTSFFSKTDWELTFDLNRLLWKDDASWDTRNAELLLNYSSARGISIPSFQIGNEPDHYPLKWNITMTPKELVKDFKTLRKLLAKYPMYKDSRVFGPVVTNGDYAPSATRPSFFEQFLDEGGANVVDEIAIHSYHMDGKKATTKDFLSVQKLDYFRWELGLIYNMTRSSSRTINIRLTETAACYNGGAPGLSDRYISGFLWLDKLGLTAQFGITRVFRQSFYGGNYALLSNNLDPRPDFFLSLLYKRLLEGPVFHVSVQPSTPYLRVYAHCTRTDRYPAGALTVYYINRQNNSVTLSLGQFRGKDLDLYLLTPGDSEGLTSRYVKLNGEKLLMRGSTLPPLLPKKQTGDVTVEGKSFGFVVIPNANVILCMEYFDQKNRHKQNNKS